MAMGSPAAVAAAAVMVVAGRVAATGVLAVMVVVSASEAIGGGFLDGLIENEIRPLISERSHTRSPLAAAAAGAASNLGGVDRTHNLPLLRPTIADHCGGNSARFRHGMHLHSRYGEDQVD